MFKNPVFRRFIKRPASVIGGIVLIIFFLTALFGPLLCRTDPNAINPDIFCRRERRALRTDSLGAMCWRALSTARVAGRVALRRSSAHSSASSGAMAGYFGKWIDTVISRAIDILLVFRGCFSHAQRCSRRMQNVIAIAFYSVRSARALCGVVITIRNSEYCQACRVFGASHISSPHPRASRRLSSTPRWILARQY
ncbi:MAG: hypothetical protein ACLSDO_00880 [Anaerotruncus colihominis]